MTPPNDPERVTPVGVERSFRAEMTTQLSISDIDRVLGFLRQIRSMFPNEEVVSSMKVGEIGLSIPEDFPTARSLIEQFGGVDELSYVALIVLLRCSVEADFGKNVLKIKAVSEPEANNLMSLWRITGPTQSAEAGPS